MVKKVKGIKVKNSQLQKTHEFSKEGDSRFGLDTASRHAVTGTMKTNDLQLDGEILLQERLSGFLFSPPHIDGTDSAKINELVNNVSEYEGFMVYLQSASATGPFVDAQKFYFCENGEWHPSPFAHSGSTNYNPRPVPANSAPTLNPMYQVSVPATGEEDSLFSLDLPTDLFIDAEGDPMTYTAALVGGAPLPAWLSFDATGTVLSGTPGESDVGSYFINITATDPDGLQGSTTQGINILVKPVPYWQGATHDFGTSGDPSWLTVGANNLPILHPSSGGSNATHEAIAADQFNISGSRTVIEFSADNWVRSSAAGNDDNQFAVLLRKSSDINNDFIGLHIRDDGQEDVRISIAHAGYSGNYWQQTRQHSFSSDSYGPADEETYADDLKYRLELGTLIPNPASAVHYVLPVMIMAMRKAPPPTVVNEGYGDFTFEQLRDEDQYWAIPASIRNKYFARKTYYWSVNNSANLPLSEHTTFQPSVWAVYDNPQAGTPLMNFDSFQISQDDMPEVNTGYIFVDWAATEGQAFSETIPADLFVDPEGETPLTYVATQDDFSALPSWLSFDPATLTFSGTPAGTDAPGLTVMVRGFDSATEAADQVYGSAGNQKLFTLTVTAAPIDNSTGTDIAFTANDDPTPLVLDSNGTLTITNPPLGQPVWGTDWIQIPTGKKLMVKWEYLPLADGTIMQASDGSYNNQSAVMIGNGGGAAWKYFQIRRPIGSDAVGYFRYQGTGTSPADNTAAIGIDMLNSEFRMETEHTSTDPTWGHRIYTATMKIRPVGGTTSFDELNDYSQTGNGYFYKESTYSSSHDLAVIWLSAYTQVMDSQGQFRKYKYLRYELVDV